MRFTGNGISHKNFRELLGEFRKDMKRAFRPKASVKDSDSESEHDGDMEMQNDNDGMWKWVRGRHSQRSPCRSIVM
jgi:hypothetical protein